jgi:hypothetical protein
MSRKSISGAACKMPSHSPKPMAETASPPINVTARVMRSTSKLILLRTRVVCEFNCLRRRWLPKFE